MLDCRQERELKPVPGLVFGLAGALATASVVALAAFAAPRPADALPAYATQTKLACGRCHVSAAGGGALTGFGKSFAANGHKVPSGGAKPGKTSGGATSSPSGATPPSSTPAVTGFNGGYYSSAVNPTFGYVPELGYSNSVDFKIYPYSD